MRFIIEYVKKIEVEPKEIYTAILVYCLVTLLCIYQLKCHAKGSENYYVAYTITLLSAGHLIFFSLFSIIQKFSKCSLFN